MSILPSRFPTRTTALVRTFILASVAAGCVCSVHAQPGRHSVSGFVFSPDRRPVTNVAVELLNEVNQVVQRTRTEASGLFMFRGLTTGRFRIRVLPLGLPFDEQSVDVEIISLAVGGSGSSVSEHRDIFLRSNRKDEPVRPAETVYVQDVPEAAKKLFESGIQELDRGNANEGVRLLTESLDVFPEYFAALERLGLEFLKLKNFEYAQAVYTKAISVNDRSFWSWYGLGVSAREQGYLTIALEAAGHAASLHPESVDAALLLGIAQRQNKDYAAAEKTFLNAKKFKSKDVHWNLALLYGNDLKRYKQAAEELERYLELLPKDSDRSSVEKLIRRFREMSLKN